VSLGPRLFHSNFLNEERTEWHLPRWIHYRVDRRRSPERHRQQNFIHPIGDIVEQTCGLIDVFRARRLPVVLVIVAGRSAGRIERAPRSMAFSEDGQMFCLS
jgi:hypothetical protein